MVHKLTYNNKDNVINVKETDVSNVAQKTSNVVQEINPLQCSKCDKVLSQKRYLNKHEEKCKGIKNSLECSTCHVILSSRYAKSRHIKTCKSKALITIDNNTNESDIIQTYKKTKIPQSLRISVWDTYIGRSIGEILCDVCKTTKISQFNFQCGHIIAEMKGGLTNIENLRPICKSCNCSMGTTNLEEYKERYF
jgi:5-methylcytosine-specific restriction endonuclease McrA